MIKARNTNLLLALVCFLFTNIALAQSDIILKTTGEEMKGKVLKMGESTIQFVYENETIVYTGKNLTS